MIDQTGRELRLEQKPERIISLVPSQTELLFHLGADVAGITRFCVHPRHWFETKPRVGGTKKIHLGKVRDLRPDLVIANKEENTREDVEAIRSFCPVWTSDVITIEDAFSMIQNLGRLTDRESKATELVETIRDSFIYIQGVGKKAIYLIWKNPYMAAGGDTFISEMMRVAGIKNVLSNRSRYPEVNIQDLRDEKIELVLLSSEPYPFKINNIEELNRILPEAKIILVDGEMFSWYGSRMAHFADYIRTVDWGN